MMTRDEIALAVAPIMLTKALKQDRKRADAPQIAKDCWQRAAVWSYDFADAMLRLSEAKK